MTENNNIIELERSVFFDSPEELDRTCKRIGNIKRRSRALGLACQFRGLDWVKVLVDNNAIFTFEDMRQFHFFPYKNPNGQLYYSLYDNFMFSLIDMKIKVRQMADQRLYYNPNNTEMKRFDSIIAFDREFSPVSEEERLKCVKYFIGLNNKTVCDLQRLLYIAIINCDIKAIDLLRENGIKLSDNACDMLTGVKESDHYFFWSFCSNVKNMTPEEFIDTVTELSRDFDYDKKMNVSVWFMDNSRKIFYEPKVFECILDRFNHKKLNQKKTMQEIITLDKPELLAICEKHGWIRMPKKRDEMIQFAADTNKTECAAWLLEFKNRTADLKAEREKAEKKLMRELNADPNSVTELKKVWGFEKRQDGGITITRYKGKRTEVDVPEKIGDMIVKEIGETAFSPEALRIKSEHREFLKTITKVTLPQTVEVIGSKAFYMCESLSEINIPKNVRIIGSYAFFCCKIANIDIPKEVSEIGASAFAGCKCLVYADLPEGITEICGGLFSDCEALQKVNIPSIVKIIGKWAFLRCFSLEKMIIPGSVEEIGEKAFAYCSKLKSLMLPQSVKKIKNRTQSGREPETAFSEDNNLTITVTEKSYGERYCKRNNIPYEVCKEV